LLAQAKVAWADVWVGAAVTAVLFSVGRLFILYYLGQTVVVKLYGSAAPLVIILLWAYYSSHILLFGAEFTAVYASECGSRLVPTDDSVAVREPAKTNEALQQSRGKQPTVSPETRKYTGRREALTMIQEAEETRIQSEA
jgi:membrane protein